MLPKSLDPDTLRTAAVVVLVVLALLVLVVMRMIQKMVLRVIFIGLLVGLGVFVWFERDYLHRCVPKCSCSVIGRTVQVPHCPIPPS
jgi:hypothetical protein